MNQAPARIALVLGGGNALGAYEVGAYAAFEQAGHAPSWIAGASVGAINAALIAGNPPGRRLAALRTFWERAASPSGPLPLVGSAWYRVAQLSSAMQTRMFGRPSLFVTAMPGLPQPVALYDAEPMRRTLAELVDFGRIAGGEPRVSVIAVDVQTGAEVVFDSARERITPDHILASAALIPDFPPVEIDGRLLVDGGLSSNVPVNVVLSEQSGGRVVCFAIDPFPRVGARPKSWIDASERQSDLMYACQTEHMLRHHAEADRLRRRLAEAGAQPAPDEVTVFRLEYAGGPDETSMKMWDFSHQVLARREAAGRADMDAALHLWRTAPPTGAGLVIHSPVRHGEP